MASLFCFALACDLREDSPQQVVDTLKYMTRSQDYEFDDPPDAEFFEGEDWRTFLTVEHEGFMFPGKAYVTFHSAYRYSRPMIHGGDDVYVYTLSLRCQSGDDGITDLIDFAEWLAPYSSTQGFVGYIIYEGLETPSLIYFRNGQVYVSEPPQPHEINMGDAW